MSDIVLSASVRQNLLSLQSTADLLSTTQNRLATGNKVNTALDNPTNYFTAQSLNNRSSDISNLLDGVSNGVQVLQAANTGITSLQKLIDSAKSVANQALQAAVGYSTKSSVTSTAITGATADNLLGTTTAASAGTYTASAALSTVNLAAATSGGQTAGANFSTLDISGTTAAASIAEANNTFTAPINVAGTTSTLAGTGTFATEDLSGTNAISFDLSFDGTTSQSITVDSAAITAAGGTPATASEANVISALNTAINTAFGTTGVTYAANNGGNIDITSGTAGTTAITKITNYTETGTLGGTSSLADGTATAGTSPNNLHFSVAVDGGSAQTVTIDQDAVNAYNTANSASLDAASLSGTDVSNLINAQLTGASSSYSTTNAALTFTSSGTSGSGTDLTITAANVAGTTTNTTGIANHAISHGTSAGGITLAITVDGGTAQSVTLNSGALTAYNSAHTTAQISDPASALTGDDVAKLISAQLTGATATFASGKLTLTSASTGTSSNVNVGAITTTGATTNTTGFTASTSGTAGVAGGSLAFSLTLDGGTAQTITLDSAHLASYNTAHPTAQIADASTALSGGDVAKLINEQAGGTVASFNGTNLVFTSTTTGTGSTVTVGSVTAAGGATDTTGIGTGGTGTTGVAASGGISGETLTIAATGNGAATSITFGSSAGQVKSLNDLNAALQSNNLLATIDAAGQLTITTTNDAASAQIGTLGGTFVTGTGAPLNGKTANAPVKDAAAQAARSNLVDQYNNILDQIKTTSQDASYNGIDLLNGDQLKLTFNETGTSTLKIQGVTFDYEGLGLSKLTNGSDFIDNASANSALSSLDKASSSLRTEASALGSNLSIVQIRQDFSKNLINVLQTGASNLTLADTNEEAANSQALSTRQSIAVSALALANQSQQSVLQLLR